MDSRLKYCNTMGIKKYTLLGLFSTIIIVMNYSTVYSQTVYQVVEGYVAPVQNTAPVANGNTVYADETNTNIVLAATDAESNPLTYTTNVTSLRYGSLAGSGSNYTYLITTNDRSDDLVDYFTFTANDGKANSNVATITINIPKIPTNIVETVVEAVKKSRRKRSGGTKNTTPAVVVPVIPVTVPVVTTPTVGVSTFSRTLVVGSKGEDVRALQKMLNVSGFKVAISGAGSPGKETTFFGPATRAALVKYQTAKGLAITGMYKTNASNAPVGTNVNSSAFSFKRDLKIGASGDDVKKLQQILNSKGFFVSTTGIGSMGNEGSYFGPKTASALSKFQKANNLPVVGWVGPKTRAFLNSL